MIGCLLRLMTGKYLILYNNHRQTLPLISHPENCRRYLFIEMSRFWRFIPFRSNDKRKYRVMYMMLNIFGPKYILDINWISLYQSLYKVWTKNHTDKKFIVLQHGSYIGGVVTDVGHRYTKCDVFLTWGDYFTRLFMDYNSGKKVEVRTFGNSIYNVYDRSKFEYSQKKSGKILFAPSGIKDKRLQALQALYKKLVNAGFVVFLVEHRFQNEKFQEISTIPKIEDNTLGLLKAHEFDIVISDHSTVLLDAIFFKNPVLFYSGPSKVEEYHNNHYTKYLVNVFNILNNVATEKDIYNIIDIDAQEKMFKEMVSCDCNNLLSEI